jgi:hypothetical protein
MARQVYNYRSSIDEIVCGNDGRPSHQRNPHAAPTIVSAVVVSPRSASPPQYPYPPQPAYPQQLYAPTAYPNHNANQNV